MNLHGNAKLTPKARLALARSVADGTSSLSAAATAFNVSVVTARKWVRRFEVDGPEGLLDRSSRPATLRAATDQVIVDRIEQLHRERLSGGQIALLTGVSTATVSRVLKRLGLSHPVAPTSAATPLQGVNRDARHDKSGNRDGYAASA